MVVMPDEQGCITIAQPAMEQQQKTSECAGLWNIEGAKAFLMAKLY